WVMLAASSSAAEAQPSEGTNNEVRQLPPVVVTGQPMPEYRRLQTSTATRTETPIIDIPQSIEAIPEKVLSDQAAESVTDAIRNAPGIYVEQGEGNRDEVYIRGVQTNSDFFIDGLRDDTQYFRPL